MPREIVDTVQRYIDAVERGDLGSAERELDPEVEIDDRDIVESTAFDSHRVCLERWNAAWKRWTVEDLRFIPVAEDTVLVLFRMDVTGKGSGIQLGRDDAVVAGFRDGKIAKIGYYSDQADARRDAGLSD